MIVSFSRIMWLREVPKLDNDKAGREFTESYQHHIWFKGIGSYPYTHTRKKRRCVSMKIILIFLFISIGMALINYGIDLLLVNDTKVATTNLFNPFWVMKPFEYLLLILLILLAIAVLIIRAIKNRNKA